MKIHISILRIIIIFLIFVIPVTDSFSKKKGYNRGKYYSRIIKSTSMSKSRKLEKLLLAHKILHYEMGIYLSNIVNVNTVGYKRKRFIYRNIVNSLSIEMSDIEIMAFLKKHTQTQYFQGALMSTENKTDLAFSGDGFFILKKKKMVLFTRAGAFGLNKDGFLVNPHNGYRLQGWLSRKNRLGDYDVSIYGNVTDLKIPIYSKLAPRATTGVKYSINLDLRKKLNEEVTTSIDIFDGMGKSHRLGLIFKKIRKNTWIVRPELTGVKNKIKLDVVTPGNRVNESGKIILKYGPNGRLDYIKDLSTGDVIRKRNFHVVFTYSTDSFFKKKVTILLGENQDSSLLNHFENFGITQFASYSTTKAVEQNGYPMGYLESFSIGKNGIITGLFSNGAKVTLGQIAVALFGNVQGLKEVNSVYFKHTKKSGHDDIGIAGKGGRGIIIAGFIEMSNVKFVEEQVKMIILFRQISIIERTLKALDKSIIFKGIEKLRYKKTIYSYPSSNKIYKAMQLHYGDRKKIRDLEKRIKVLEKKLKIKGKENSLKIQLQ